MLSKEEIEAITDYWIEYTVDPADREKAKTLRAMALQSLSRPAAGVGVQLGEDAVHVIRTLDAAYGPNCPFCNYAKIGFKHEHTCKVVVTVAALEALKSAPACGWRPEVIEAWHRLHLGVRKATEALDACENYFTNSRDENCLACDAKEDEDGGLDCKEDCPWELAIKGHYLLQDAFDILDAELKLPHPPAQEGV